MPMPRVFVPAVLSALLLWAAFFPLNVGPLGFVALVPWLSLVRAPVSRRRRYFAAYLGGVAFFALATNWVRVAHPMMSLSWLGLAVVAPVFWVVALAFIRRLDRLGLPLALSVPLAWVALEFARMHFPTGYPFLKGTGFYQMIGFGWYSMGYTQHAFLPFIQIADLGGVYAVSFVVAAVNGLLTDWALRSAAVRRWLRWPDALPATAPSRPHLRIVTAAVLALFAVSLGYGFVRLSHPEFATGPRVAAIQGSVPQDEKILRGGGLVRSYGALHFAAAGAEPTPDLVVWPETCFAGDWFEVAPGQTPNAEFTEQVEACTAYFDKLRFRVPVLLGLNGHDWQNGRGWRYNSALMLDATGAKVGRYDKMHLVPFGEYVPLGNYLPFMAAFTPYKHDYSCRPGESWTRFPLKTSDGRAFTFGCLICYEDSDPYLARQYVASQPVDFLVNISNDGWFDGTEEHEQHLAICRFRAVEARRAIVRAVNMGISGFIDSDGRVLAIPGETWSKSKKMEGIVTAAVPIDTRGSLYASIGDTLPAMCWLLIVLGAIAARVRRPRTTPNVTQTSP